MGTEPTEAALAPAPSLREMCVRHDIRFKKALGQNLLLDDNINRIMVEAAALTEEDAVIEVGAGLGALTRRLCRHAGRVFAVEIDTAGAIFAPIFVTVVVDTLNPELVLPHLLFEGVGLDHHPRVVGVDHVLAGSILHANHRNHAIPILILGRVFVDRSVAIVIHWPDVARPFLPRFLKKGLTRIRGGARNDINRLLLK